MDEPRAPAEPTLAAGSEFEGLLVLRGAARIDGRLRGQVIGSDLVWISESGRVEASIEAEEVVVAGEVQGEVRARRRIALLPGSRVTASLEAPRMTLAEGCFLEGRCRSGPDVAAGGASTPQGS